MNIVVVKSKKRKRSMQISIKNVDQVLVSVPFFTAQKAIDNFINSNLPWIHKNLSKIKKVPIKNFIEGEKFLIMGNSVPLVFSNTKKSKNLLNVEKNSFVYYGKNTSSAELKYQFLKFYKKFGKQYATIKSNEFAKIIKKDINKITIKNIKTQWGSCSSKNNLNYNYKLFMAPKEVVDYVIAHEVAHLKHKHHKKSFWDLVEQLYPNYKVYRKWLKTNGHTLTI